MRDGLTITASHLLQIIPAAPITVVEQFFNDAGEGRDVINDILFRTGIIDPRAIAMFLAIAAYDSENFTKYRAEGHKILTGAEWLYARAMKWCDLKLNILAEQDTLEAFSAVVERASYGTANLAHRRQLWERVCVALGVSSESQKTMTDDLTDWNRVMEDPEC